MTYASTVLTDTPLSYWKLNEGSQVAAVDAGSRTTNGAYSAAGVTYSATGPLTDGSAETGVSFNGSTGYMSVAAYANIPRPFTIEFFLKSSNSSNSPVIVEHGDITDAGFRLCFGGAAIGGTTGQIAIRINDSGLTDPTAFSTATTYNDGAWHHVAVVVDTATGVQFYMDGLADGTQQGLSTAPTSTAAALYVACRNAADSFTNLSMEDLALYGVALNSTQVAAHYAARLLAVQTSHVTSIVANASTWTDQVGSSVSADLVTALDDSTATYIKSPGNPAGSGPITIHTGPLSKPNAGDRNFVVGLQKSANTGTMDYTVECKKSGGASVQTFNKDASAGATLVAALGNVASTGATATCTVTNAIADGDWANGFDWVVTPNKSA